MISLAMQQSMQKGKDNHSDSTHEKWKGQLWT